MSATRIDGVVSDVIAADSRGLAYGDGVFRTLLAIDGVVQRFDAQYARLAADAAALELDAPDAATLHADSQAVLADSGLAQAALKWMLVRASGTRGYRSTTRTCMRIVSAAPAPVYPPALWRDGAVADIAPFTLAMQPRLAGLKHLNRLELVLASRDWPDGIDERLLCDAEGFLVGGTRSNLFWLKQGALYTPALDRCGIRGMMRGEVLALAARVGLAVHEVREPATTLHDADEVFICNALIGLWPLRRIGTQDYAAPGAWMQRLQAGLAHPHVEGR